MSQGQNSQIELVPPGPPPGPPPPDSHRSNRSNLSQAPDNKEDLAKLDDVLAFLQAKGLSNAVSAVMREWNLRNKSGSSAPPKKQLEHQASIHIRRRDLQKYETAFQNADSRATGRLQFDAARRAFIECMGTRPNEALLRTQFALADRDGRGALDFDEFMVLVVCMELAMNKDANTAHVTNIHSKLRVLFDFIDSDGNGFISPPELLQVMKLLGVRTTLRKCKWMIQSTNMNAKLSAHEHERIEALFDEMDVTGNGFLESDEIQLAFKKSGVDLPRDKAREMILEFDENQDMRIDLLEFKLLHTLLLGNADVPDELGYDNFLRLLQHPDIPYSRLLQLAADGRKSGKGLDLLEGSDSDNDVEEVMREAMAQHRRMSSQHSGLPVLQIDQDNNSRGEGDDIAGEHDDDPLVERSPSQLREGSDNADASGGEQRLHERAPSRGGYDNDDRGADGNRERRAQTPEHENVPPPPPKQDSVLMMGQMISEAGLGDQAEGAPRGGGAGEEGGLGDEGDDDNNNGHLATRRGSGVFEPAVPILERRTSVDTMLDRLANALGGGKQQALLQRFKDERVPFTRVRHFQQTAAYLEDAFHGRLKNGKGSNFYKPTHIRWAFAIHAHPRFKLLLECVALLFCLVMFVEPPNHKKTSWDTQRVTGARVVELLCLVVLLSDYALRSVYMGQRKIFQKMPFRLLYGIEVLCTLDVLVAFALGGVHLRPTRCLRPWLYVIINKNSLVLVNLIAKSARRLVSLLSLLLLWIVFVALVINQVASTELWESKDHRWDSNFLFRPYGNAWRTVLSLWTLTTHESYVEFVQPYADQRPELLAVFVVFVAVAFYVILNITVAVQADEFKQLQLRTVATEIKKRRKTLDLVFRMVTQGKDEIEYEDLRLLLLCYHPHLNEKQVEFFFRETDVDGSGAIDKEEFMDLCEILSTRGVIKGKMVSTYMDHTEVFQSLSLRKSQSRMFQGVKWRKRVGGWLRLKWVQRAFVALIVVDTALVFSVTETSSSMHANLVSWADYALFAINIAHTVLVKVALHGRKRFWKSRTNRMNTYLLGLSAALLASSLGTRFYFRDVLKFHSHTWFNGQALACALRIPQLAQVTPGIRMYATLVMSTAPVVRDFAFLIGAVMYSYGVIAMEVFPNSVFYDSPKAMWQTVLRLMILEGWHEVMFEVMEDTNDVAKEIFAAVFHSLLTMVLDVFIISQLMAVMYELFNATKHVLSQARAHKGGRADSSGNLKGDAERKRNVNMNWRHLIARQEENRVGDAP